MRINWYERLDAACAALPALLDEDGWKSLYIDYEKPHVERLHRNLEDGFRLMLHVIHPCERAEAFWHPHPWPSIVRVVKGAYETGIGSIETNRPTSLATVVRGGPGLTYLMPDPEVGHYVLPLGGEVWSIMLTGPMFISAASERFTKAKPILSPLSDARVAELKDRWRGLL